MKCPLCNVLLTAHERQGIEIDMCPKCRGIWLDRGELEKLIERSETHFRDRGYDHDDEDDDDHRFRRRHEDRHHPRQRRSWWSELFD